MASTGSQKVAGGVSVHFCLVKTPPRPIWEKTPPHPSVFGHLMGVFAYLMGVLGYLMGVLRYLMGVLGYLMAWRRRQAMAKWRWGEESGAGPHSGPRSRSAPLSSPPTPLVTNRLAVWQRDCPNERPCFKFKFLFLFFLRFVLQQTRNTANAQHNKHATPHKRNNKNAAQQKRNTTKAQHSRSATQQKRNTAKNATPQKRNTAKTQHSKIATLKIESDPPSLEFHRNKTNKRNT